MPWDAADLDALIALLRAHAVRTGHFVLASGQTSSVCCDVKKVSLRADGAWLIGRGLLALAREADPSAQAVGGLTLGADPLISEGTGRQALAGAGVSQRQLTTLSQLLHAE